MIVQVIINSNVKTLNRIFDYNVPESLEGTICVVDIILVPFGNKKTLDEIGTIYGVSRERIRQIENRAISKLKKLCKNRNMTSGLKNYFGS